MAGDAWQEAEEAGGIMLFVPAAKTEIEATQQTLSRLNVCEEEIQETDSRHIEPQLSLSPLRGGHTCIQADGDEEYLSDVSCSSVTLSTHDDSHVLTPDSSILFTPSSATMDPFFEQLKAFAKGPSTSESVLPSVELPNPRISIAESDIDCDTDYDSDRTDFLLTRKSPCPSRAAPIFRRRTGMTGRSLQAANKIRSSKPIRRTLDFGVSAKNKTFKVTKKSVQISRKSKSKSTLSLENLQGIERKPRHNWSAFHKQLLLIIRRWYCTTDYAEITAIFNTITGLDLNKRTVDTQFREIQAYGSKASLEWADVFDNVTFEDPSGVYVDIYGKFEAVAKDLGISLRRREEEERFSSGSAAYASPRTRQKFRDRVRMLARQKRSEAQAPRQTLRSIPWATNPSTDDAGNLMDLEEAENLPSPPVKSLDLKLNRPANTCIAFRVWDEDSRTKFTEDRGFVSEAHSIWKGPLLEPFIPEGQGKEALMFLSNLHLSMTGNASAFVSVCTSLVQCLTKASTMKNPRIAVIALDHHLLTEPYKTLEAAQMLRLLKDEGQAWWARYKGYSERMIWADCPRESIIHYFPLAELSGLSDADPACASLLHLEAFEPGRKTFPVCRELRERKTQLSTATAHNMGSIAKSFGMDGGVSLSHIEGFIISLVDGWSITGNPANDIHTSSSHASSFALCLGSKVHHLQAIMGVFQTGVQHGLENLEYYSRRRKTRQARAV